METTGCLSDTAVYKAGILKREAEGSTAIGEGVAIPHAKTDAVKRPALAVMVVPDGCDYDAIDGQPARLFFMIAAPDTEDNVHLDVLGRLSVLLMEDNFRQHLMEAKDADEFLALIDRAEQIGRASCRERVELL